jgi:hypothetical protein
MIFESLFLNILFYIALFLVLLIIMFFIIFDDSQLIFLYVFNKKNLKFKMLTRLVKEEEEIYILGSLHHMHDNLPDFSFQHLKAVLTNLKPDILLIESRQEELEKGNFADGPIEMFYLHMVARELNIPVKGVDWFSYDESKPGTTNKKRDNMITQNIINSSKGHNKVLVVVGGTHMLVGTKMLKKSGYKRADLSLEFKNSVYSNIDNELVFPRDTIKYINKRIEIEKGKLQSQVMNEVWRNATLRVILDLENFINKIEVKQLNIEK